MVLDYYTGWYRVWKTYRERTEVGKSLWILKSVDKGEIAQGFEETLSDVRIFYSGVHIRYTKTKEYHLRTNLT